MYYNFTILFVLFYLLFYNKMKNNVKVLQKIFLQDKKH